MGQEVVQAHDSAVRWHSETVQYNSYLSVEV